MEAFSIVKRFAQTPANRWPNGAGVTSELLGFAETASLTPFAPRWRLSVAQLIEPAVFSELPGIWRTLLPVGAAVRLEVGGVVHEVADGSPLEFDGGISTRLVALSVPCYAVNLMVEALPRRAEVRLTRGALDATALVAVALRTGARCGAFDLVAPVPDSWPGAREEAWAIVRVGQPAAQ
ncbi:MAG: HutD family protein [Microbacterium sp.]